MNELLAAGWGMGLAAQAEGEPRFFLKARSVFPPSGQGGLRARLSRPTLTKASPFFVQGRTMSKEELSIHDTIEYLNELLALDAKAMAAMSGSRVIDRWQSS
jgi:hypothetical protein